MRTRIVEEGRKWINTPWRHQGRSIHGIDCVGLLYAINAALKLSYYDIKGYGRDPEYDFVSHLIISGFTRIPLQDAVSGDMLLFRSSVRPTHVAILTDNRQGPYLLHASAKARKVVEEPYDHEWKALVISAWTFPGAN